MMQKKSIFKADDGLISFILSFCWGQIGQKLFFDTKGGCKNPRTDEL
jgi:hypothetical protein